MGKLGCWDHARTYGVRSVSGERWRRESWREEQDGRDKARAQVRAEARRRRKRARVQVVEVHEGGRWIRP